MRVCLLLLVVFSLAPASWAAPSAEDDDRPALPELEVQAVRIGPVDRVALDGVLDEVAWAMAEVATGFTQMRPNPGEASTQLTEAYVLYDDDALYVGFRCHDDEPEAIVRRLARRDDWNVSDKVVVSIDSYATGGRPSPSASTPPASSTTSSSTTTRTRT